MLCKIDDLPDEILEYILGLIPPYKNLQECTLVSKRWYRATKSTFTPFSNSYKFIPENNFLLQ